MSETRDQYRERLAWTAYRAFMDHIKIDGTKEYDELLSETKDAMNAEAEAVAAQVLRDLAQKFETRGVSSDSEVKADTHAMKVLYEFARERGINLSE